LHFIEQYLERGPVVINNLPHDRQDFSFALNLAQYFFDAKYHFLFFDLPARLMEIAIIWSLDRFFLRLSFSRHNRLIFSEIAFFELPLTRGIYLPP